MYQEQFTASVQLDPEQRDALDRLLAFEKDVTTLGGLAGTGKTTLIRTLARHLPNFAVCAFTGKAANVLTRKGVRASTIHRLIYNPTEIHYRDEHGRQRKRTVFRLRRGIPHDGIIIDEASMVSRGIFDDLCSFGLPTIFVGDHGQLEPVGDARFNLMAAPDITLERIHRNAGEIARFANFIREGNDPLRWPQKPGSIVEFRPLARSSMDQWRADQILCAFNTTRVSVNRRIRTFHGYPADEPTVGDRVMCLQNDYGAGVFNGMQGKVIHLNGDSMVFRAQDEEFDVRYRPDHFNCARHEIARGGNRLSFDYAYCVTAHKAQGDEWPHVLVIEERLPKIDHRRWCYTAASRARTRLTWVRP